MQDESPEDLESQSTDAHGDSSTASPPKERQAAIAFILLTLFLDILGIGIVIPVLPELVKQFVGEDSANAGFYYGLIGTVYSLTQFIFAPIIGALSDRFGRRPVILASLFGFGVDFILQGFAPSIWWLFLGRFVAGIMGASFTTANAYIADVSTPENRARNFGLTGVMFGLGFILGPTLGGMLGEVWVRLPFFVAAGLALANWLYGYFILPESLPPEKRSKTFKLASPLEALKHLGAYPLVAGLAGAFACMSLAQRGLENVWVLYTAERFGWSPRANGLTLGLVGLMAALVQGGMVRPTVKRLGERKTVLLGLTVSVMAFLGYGFSYRPWMLFTTIVFGALAGLAGPAMQSLVAGSVDADEQGRVQGALASIMSATNVIAPLLFTTGLFSYFTSEKAFTYAPGAPFYLGAVLMLTGLLIVRGVFRGNVEAAPTK